MQDPGTLAAELIDALLAAQLLLLRGLAALGLVDDVAGQPAWPFGARIAIETLALDRGLARSLAWTLLAVTIALGLLLLGLAWRRARPASWIGALALLVLAPWPAPALVLAPAVPTSFHRSPGGFEADSVARGLPIYRQRCAECHGADGRGEGPRAASLPVWPPTLSAGLLWKRPEGELYWRVRHGLRGRDGRETMPAFALQDDEVWAVLDAMKAIAAGDAARRQLGWDWPVRPPGLTITCPGQPPQRLADWRGRRVRLAVIGGDGELPGEDPRLETVVLLAGARPDAGAQHRCHVASTSASPAWAAYAEVAGVEPQALGGMQFIVDRAGWLRALNGRGQGWSEADLLCRAPDGEAAPSAGPRPDGLGDLIARMDREPVRTRRGAAPHSW